MPKPNMPVLTGFRIVHYRLTAVDVSFIESRRKADPTACAGNTVIENMEFPMLIVRDWGNGCVNGRVFLDGTDDVWVTSRVEGEGPGAWHWPEQV